MSEAGLWCLPSSDSPKRPMHGEVMGVFIVGGPSFRADETGTQSIPAGASIGWGAEMAGDARDDEDFFENNK